MSEKILRGVFSTKYENFPIFSSFNINIFLQYTSVLGCVGRGMGPCVGCVLGRVGCVRAVGERNYRSPLYYPDTLVNPDTCLGYE